MCVSLRRFVGLRSCVWGAATWHHLPRGVSRGQDNHELPSTSQPTCHIQVTYASNCSSCALRLLVAERASFGARLNFCSVAPGSPKYCNNFYFPHHYLAVRSLIMPVWSISLSWSHSSSPLIPPVWAFFFHTPFSSGVWPLVHLRLIHRCNPCRSQHPSSLIQFSSPSPLGCIPSILICPESQRPFGERDLAPRAHFLSSWLHYKSTYSTGLATKTDGGETIFFVQNDIFGWTTTNL